MSQTRRQTLVTVLNGGTPTPGELHAMNAVEGVQDFLALTASRGLTGSEVVDRLVAFKTEGGSGLANAIEVIANKLVDGESADAGCGERLEAVRAALQAALDAIE